MKKRKASKAEKGKSIMKSIKKVLGVAFAGALLVGCGSSDTASATTDSSTEETAAAAAEDSASTVYRTLEEIQASGVIYIGVFGDKAPFGYVNEYGDYDGYDVYFAERIAQDLGVEVEYTALDPSARIDAVNTGKVDITLANFTVTAERAEKVDFALPYMKVQLGVVSSDDNLITDIQQLIDNNEELIIAKGTTAETYFEANYPDVTLQKYDAYADAYNALLDLRGAALSTDNTEVLAWANSNPGFTVGITAIGDVDTIAPAVAKGNETLLNWLNEEIVALGEENFFHEDYEATLRDVYGADSNPDDMVVEGGQID